MDRFLTKFKEKNIAANYLQLISILKMIGSINGSHHGGQTAHGGLECQGAINQTEGHIESNQHVAICDTTGSKGAKSNFHVEKCQDERENGLSSKESDMQVT